MSPLPLAPTEEALAAHQAQVCRQLADFLGCPDDDERPRIRVLRLLLTAAASLGRPFRTALRQGPLWTALLRLATGRGSVSGGGGRGAEYAGRAPGGGGGGGDGVRARGATSVGAAAGGGWGGKTVLGPTNALARDVVAAAREDRGHGGTDAAGSAEPRRWNGRGSSGSTGR